MDELKRDQQLKPKWMISILLSIFTFFVGLIVGRSSLLLPLAVMPKEHNSSQYQTPPDSSQIANKPLSGNLSLTTNQNFDNARKLQMTDAGSSKNMVATDTETPPIPSNAERREPTVEELEASLMEAFTPDDVKPRMMSILPVSTQKYDQVRVIKAVPNILKSFSLSKPYIGSVAVEFEYISWREDDPASQKIEKESTYVTYNYDPRKGWQKGNF